MHRPEGASWWWLGSQRISFAHFWDLHQYGTPIDGYEAIVLRYSRPKTLLPETWRMKSFNCTSRSALVLEQIYHGQRTGAATLTSPSIWDTSTAVRSGIRLQGYANIGYLTQRVTCLFPRPKSKSNPIQCQKISRALCPRWISCHFGWDSRGLLGAKYIFHSPHLLSLFLFWILPAFLLIKSFVVITTKVADSYWHLTTVYISHLRTMNGATHLSSLQCRLPFPQLNVAPGTHISYPISPSPAPVTPAAPAAPQSPNLDRVKEVCTAQLVNSALDISARNDSLLRWTGNKFKETRVIPTFWRFFECWTEVGGTM